MPYHAASSDPATREIFGSIPRGRSRDLPELVPQQVADAAAHDPNGFALVLRGLGSAVSPWRRFMAGNFRLIRRAMETGFLDGLQDYLFHGMVRRKSWMLDQNAISYAVEGFGGDIEDVNNYSRLFRTMRFVSIWEANFRRTTAQAR